MGSSDLAGATEFSFHRTFANAISMVGRSYAVQDASGTVVFAAANHPQLTEDDWVITDARGVEVAQLRRGAMHVHPTFDLTSTDGLTVRISKANFMPLHETWRIEGLAQGTVDIKGSTSDHEFTFVDAAGATLVQASRRWASVREAYGLRVDPAFDMRVVVAAAVALDMTESTH